MTRTSVDALARLRVLACGLPLGDVGRLLERVAQADDVDALRAALTLVGAAALLGDVQADLPADRGCAAVAAPAAAIVAAGGVR